jgi:hypothetical protein
LEGDGSAPSSWPADDLAAQEEVHGAHGQHCPAVRPVLIALNDWAERWIVPAGAATISLLHHDCGSPVRTVVTCASGHEITTPGQVSARPGPGARPASASD